MVIYYNLPVLLQDTHFNIIYYSGIGFAQRQMGKLVTSYEEISQDGDTWTLSIHASIKRGRVSFKLGEEFDETTLDGRRVTVCTCIKITLVKLIMRVVS